jgi:hypothetical protein
MASAWADRTTAEHWVTECLRRHEAELRAWAAGSSDEYLPLTIPAPESVGHLLVRDGDEFTIRPPNGIKVVVVKDGGDVFLKTAYPTTVKE